MKSICTTKKRRRLVQVEWTWCNKLSKDNFKHKLCTTHNLWEEATLPSLQYILCLSTRTTSKYHFSLGLPTESPKIKIFIISKLWTFIFFSNQIYFENARGIFHSLQKGLFNNVQNTLIGIHLTPIFKGFFIKSQILNLTLAPSFDHNSCKSRLNEQCVDTLNMYASKPF